MMNYIKSLSTVGTSVGLGTLLAVGLAGCGGQSQEQAATQQQKQPAFVVIEEVTQGRYKIAEEFPAKETRIILKKLDGTERVLTEQELDYLIKQEAAKIEQGTSNLTKPQEAQVTQQGMGLGETILASAAGYMLGAWIGSKLFGNQAYQNNRKAGYKSPSTYSRSKNSFKKSTAKRTASKKGGFFGTKKKSSGFFGGKRRSGGFFGG
jgi:hypothetical protein